VWVNAEEIKRLAARLGMTEAAFGKRYLRQVGERVSLVEKRGGDCIFWDQEMGCTVYEARPIQCRTWPFWAENVATPETWARTQEKCPGSGRGRLHTVEQIERAVRRTPE
jgi:Fe-S-cluster containining protein